MDNSLRDVHWELEAIYNANIGLGLGLWYFNATFNNITAIPWLEIGVSGVNHRPVASH
jgi:hypothetical protein